MAKKPKKTESFAVHQYLSDAGVSRRISMFKKGQVIFSQDDPCDDVLYIQSGNAKLTIVNPQGKVLLADDSDGMRLARSARLLKNRPD